MLPVSKGSPLRYGMRGASEIKQLLQIAASGLTETKQKLIQNRRSIRSHTKEWDISKGLPFFHHP